MKTETRMDQLSVGITTLTASYSAHSMAICDSRLSKNQQSSRGQQLLIDNDNDWQRVRRRPMSLRPVQVLSLSLVLPQWLAQYSLQMSVCKAAQGWSLNLKPYRTMPYNNDLRMVIARGNDFDAFRSFFDSGQATVFDRDEHGWTILHVRLAHRFCCSSLC
jgi:ankyrin repeat protein